MENKREICMVINGEMIPMPQKTPQESIESACVERVGGVYFTTAKELDEQVEKTRKEKYLRKKKLRAYREKCGLLIDEAATLLGISKTYLVKIENGEKDPTLELALKIAKFYKTTVDELFG